LHLLWPLTWSSAVFLRSVVGDITSGTHNVASHHRILQHKYILVIQRNEITFSNVHQIL